MACESVAQSAGGAVMAECSRNEGLSQGNINKIKGDRNTNHAPATKFETVGCLSSSLQ
jgi:hypothetical protein